MTQDVYAECCAVIRRHSEAYDYAMERVDCNTANAMIYQLQPIAGWFPLSTISVDWVCERAVESDYGEWEDFPEAYELACEATEYVAQHWEDGDNGATDWAIQKFEEFAAERGITLVPCKDED